MIAYAKAARIYTRLHTNGTLLDKERSKKLIESGLDSISFSFDGYLKKTYEKNRAGADYGQTLSNIRSFLKLKKEMGSKSPVTAIQVIEYEEGLSKKDLQKQRKDFLKKLTGLGLDQFNRRKPHNWGGLIKDIALDKDRATSACTFCWYSLTILYDGKICLCPQDFEARIVIGDVRKTSIAKIFNAKQIRDIRQKNKDGQIAKMIPCRNCDRIYRKTLFGVPTQSLRTFLAGR